MLQTDEFKRSFWHDHLSSTPCTPQSRTPSSTQRLSWRVTTEPATEVSCHCGVVGEAPVGDVGLPALVGLIGFGGVILDPATVTIYDAKSVATQTAKRPVAEVRNRIGHLTSTFHQPPQFSY